MKKEIKNIDIAGWFMFKMDDWKLSVLAYSCDYELVGETEKAVKINVKPNDSHLKSKRPEGYDMWFPKSVVTILY